MKERFSKFKKKIPGIWNFVTHDIIQKIHYASDTASSRYYSCFSNLSDNLTLIRYSNVIYFRKTEVNL